MPTTRFAPSPTGALHLGHVHAALFAQQLAGPNGRFLLRIEDLDPVRCRPEHVTAIKADLAWLGLAWPCPVRRQSRHLSEYRGVLDRLADRGLLYACFCTRAAVARAAISRTIAAPATSRAGHSDAAGGSRQAGLAAPEVLADLDPGGGADLHAPHAAEPVYPGTCRRLDPAERRDRVAQGEPHAWRLDMAVALHSLADPLTRTELSDGAACTLPCDPGRFGDVVLGRRDVPASYHLCVTHDDALQGVTLVTRAEDLRPASELHRLLQVLMGWPEPAYAHHPLLRDNLGRRLSKRRGAPTIAGLRAQGVTPDAVRAMAGFREALAGLPGGL